MAIKSVRRVRDVWARRQSALSIIIGEINRDSIAICANSIGGNAVRVFAELVAFTGEFCLASGRVQGGQAGGTVILGGPCHYHRVVYAP